MPTIGLVSERPRIDPKQEAATALYRTLEIALITQGISRPVSLPPLRHAEDLAAKSHPLAEDILDLTNRYLAARFGGILLKRISGALRRERSRASKRRMRRRQTRRHLMRRCRLPRPGW